MKYKVGEKVVLKSKETLKIASVTKEKTYVSVPFWDSEETELSTIEFADKHIDHEKTAELNNTTLEHYEGELEKVVAEKNGHEVERTDVIEPEHHRKGNKTARHKEITDYMHQTYISKNKDYGDSFGVVHKEIGKEASLGQIAHKYNRLKNIILNESTIQVEDETVIDTIIDMANYLVMFAIELEEDA